MNDGTFALSFGAMSPPLSSQLSHTRIPMDTLLLFDRIADAMVLLRVKGIMSGTEHTKAVRRLVKLIEKKMKETDR